MSVNQLKEWLDLDRMEGHVAMLVLQLHSELFYFFLGQCLKEVTAMK
jgi:hypothetical protein